MNRFNPCFSFLLFLLSGCALPQENTAAEEMYIKASALTKLSAAVESMVRYKNPSPSWTDSELLSAATEHNPALLNNLDGYRLRVQNRNRHAIVLMCSASAERALLEDAGCTGQMDRHHWQVPSRCEFTLSVEQICGAN
jgi:hypothetical protein